MKKSVNISVMNSKFNCQSVASGLPFPVFYFYPGFHFLLEVCRIKYYEITIGFNVSIDIFYIILRYCKDIKKLHKGFKTFDEFRNLSTFTLSIQIFVLMQEAYLIELVLPYNRHIHIHWPDQLYFYPAKW